MTTLKRIFWASLMIKLILTAICPLTNDEAYYWVWSQHMQLSYYDHPPFVAWLMWLGNHVNFYGNMLRWPAVLMGQAALALWLLILKPYLSEEQRVYFLLLALLSPLYGGTQLIVTPDLPLIFFYALALLAFYRWREKPNVSFSVLFGLSMGLGFTSKYVMVLFPLSLFPLIWISRELRKPLFKTLHWIVLGAVVGALPVWLWNLLNDFASFKYQAAHGLGRSHWKWSWTTDYILLQILLIFPTVLYCAIRGRRNLPLVYQLLAWVPLGFFFCTTFRGYVEANWPIVAYPAVFALAVTRLPKNSRVLKFSIGFWAFALSLLFTIILLQPNWARDMKFKEFHEFDHLISSAGDLEPIYARSYQMASKMSYEMKRPIYKLRGMNRLDFFDYLPQSLPPRGLYYLAVEKTDQLPPDIVKAGHRRTHVLPVDENFEIWQMQAP